MKFSVIAAFVLLSIAGVLFSQRVWPANAPELFGVGTWHQFRLRSRTIGWVQSPMGVWVFIGLATPQAHVGVLRQVYGPTVWDRETPTGPSKLPGDIHFDMVSVGPNWQGTIFFRGHGRKLILGKRVLR